MLMDSSSNDWFLYYFESERLGLTDNFVDSFITLPYFASEIVHLLDA